MHKEIPVKVTAWVDEAVAPLVLALNEHPCIQTLDSCEDRGNGIASVFFRVRECDPWEFFRLFACILMHPAQCAVALNLDWHYECDSPTAEIKVSRDFIKDGAREVHGAIQKMLNPEG